MIGPTDYELDDSEQRQARIARPTSSPFPALTLRGLNLPTASTSPSATPAASPNASPENEVQQGAQASRGLMSTGIAKANATKPSALDTRKLGDETELNRLQGSPSGIGKIQKNHPILGGVLRGLETVGDVLSPAVTAMIPGTELHHNRLLTQARGRVDEDVAQQGKEAATGKTQADTEEAEARTGLTNEQAKVAGNPKQGLTPEETTIHDLMTGQSGAPRINPKTNQPYTYLEAYEAVQQAKQDVKPEKAEKPDTPEQQFIDEYHRTHPGSTVSQAVSAYSAATQKPERPGAGSARADKSYSYNNDKLDKLGKPIEDAVARMGRLRETLAQGSPQSDALIAPELLTIMAGGAGSGLRMNEAEISRIVGGRSKWQSLEASINQWRIDPTKANSITPEQRQQIKALVDAVNVKLTQKQQALDAARDSLLNSDDPKEHRRIVTSAHHSLTQIDEAVEGGRDQNTVNTAKSVKINGQDIALAADGTFQLNGHTYKDNGDGKSATLVK